MTYTMMSKRYLLALVNRGVVSGWDDPRMPTIAGMRRRGYTAAALRNFATAIGVTKANGINEFQQLEYYVREDLNKFFFSSRRRHTRSLRDWSSDVCSSDL